MKKDEFTKTSERLREINEVVKDLEPALQDSAVRILAPYATGLPIFEASNTPPPDNPGRTGTTDVGESDVRRRLLDEHGDGKPGDNALMCAAIWFSEYGKSPFSLDQLREIGNELGVTVPDRLDATIGAGQRQGKKLFNRVRQGHYSPTVNGETFLKATYGVTQGRATPALGE